MPQVLRRFWSQPRQILRDLLAVDDSAHAIAAGATVGIFIGLTPTVGIQMILVAILAVFARGWLYFNRTAALLMVYVTNPLTLVPIYWFNYTVGADLIGGDAEKSELSQALHYDSLASWWESVQTLAVTIGAPLLVGSLVVATVASVLMYPAVRFLVRRFRDAAPATDEAAASPPEKPASRQDVA